MKWFFKEEDKNYAHVQSVGRNEQHVFYWKEKIMNFPIYKYKSQSFAQSQHNFAHSNNGETVRFRNSAPVLIYHTPFCKISFLANASTLINALCRSPIINSDI